MCCVLVSALLSTVHNCFALRAADVSRRSGFMFLQIACDDSILVFNRHVHKDQMYPWLYASLHHICPWCNIFLLYYSKDFVLSNGSNNIELFFTMFDRLGFFEPILTVKIVVFLNKYTRTKNLFPHRYRYVQMLTGQPCLMFRLGFSAGLLEGQKSNPILFDRPPVTQ